VLSGIKGLWSREPGSASLPLDEAEAAKETPQEFAARAALIPPGIAVQTYVNQVSVEQEVPKARAVVAQASGLLENLVHDVRLGKSFDVERVEEIVDDMVDSIVRNPDALMWVARLREQDIATYGHGLQVSVYLTSFGRHIGFPKPQLSQLAQIGMLLDIGKIRSPAVLETGIPRPRVREATHVARPSRPRGRRISPGILEAITSTMDTTRHPAALARDRRFDRCRGSPIASPPSSTIALLVAGLVQVAAIGRGRNHEAPCPSPLPWAFAEES
jgi:hypothetical protein